MQYLSILASLLLYELASTVNYSSTDNLAVLYELEEFFTNDYEPALRKSCFEDVKAMYDFYLDLRNKIKMKNRIDTDMEYSELVKQKQKILHSFKYNISNLDYESDISDDLKAQIRHYYNYGTGEYNEIQKRKTLDFNVKLSLIYGTAKVCPYSHRSCDVNKDGIGDPDIADSIEGTHDYHELEYYWKEWRKATGGRALNTFKEYVKWDHSLSDSSKSNAAETKETISKDAELALTLWKNIEPFYMELHKYVRKRLKEYYGNKIDLSDGMIPAHLTGNLWSETWYRMEQIVRPFPKVSDGNLERNLRKNFTVEAMFKLVDEYFQSTGLKSMSDVYMSPNRMIEKPKDREVVCYPMSMDFCNNTYSTSMCARPTLENLIQIAHELGHVQYFKHYEDLIPPHKDSPSFVFHETIGDVFALGITSANHLAKVGILTNYKDTYEANINHLMKMALIRVAVLPFSFVVGMWRWDVEKNRVSPDKWNSHWWELKKKYQKIKPPTPRLDTDFDPGALYHVLLNSPFMPYYFAHIMSHQIHKRLCLDAEDEDPVEYTYCPLHRCNFFKSKRAGNLVGDALKLGSKKEWQTVLEMLSGDEDYNTDAMLEYFAPLYEFLKKENIDTQSIEEESIEPPPFHVHLTIAIIFCILLPLMFTIWMVWIFRDQLRPYFVRQ